MENRTAEISATGKPLESNLVESALSEKSVRIGQVSAANLNLVDVLM